MGVLYKNISVCVCGKVFLHITFVEDFNLTDESTL